MNRLIHQLYYDGKITQEVCQQLLDQLSKSKADEIIDLEVIRDSKKINLKVKLGAK